MTPEAALDLVESVKVDSHPQTDYVQVVSESAHAPRRNMCLAAILAGLGALGALDNRRATVVDAAHLTIRIPRDLGTYLVQIAKAHDWRALVATAFAGLTQGDS